MSKKRLAREIARIEEIGRIRGPRTPIVADGTVDDRGPDDDDTQIDLEEYA